VGAWQLGHSRRDIASALSFPESTVRNVISDPIADRSARTGRPRKLPAKGLGQQRRAQTSVVYSIYARAVLASAATSTQRMEDAWRTHGPRRRCSATNLRASRLRDPQVPAFVTDTVRLPSQGKTAMVAALLVKDSNHEGRTLRTYISHDCHALAR